jgi:hypothetical protein
MARPAPIPRPVPVPDAGQEHDRREHSTIWVLVGLALTANVPEAQATALASRSASG